MSAQASRSTYRERAGKKCYQRQVRERYEGEGEPPVPHKDVGKARVKRVGRDVAEQIIMKYEWLGTLPSGITHFYGIFFGPYCAGVTCLGVGAGGANINACKEWDLTQDELAYLARGACVHWAPPNTNSKLISWTCRLVAEQSSARLAIAYADTDAGEIGTVYQAANWTCVGFGSSTRQWIAPNGRIYDQKLPSNLRARDGKKYPRQAYVRKLKKAGYERQRSNPKIRYVKILSDNDPSLEALVREKATEYPKRHEIFDQYAPEA